LAPSSGNIGTDLLLKVQRSPLLECTLFIGRQANSKGLQVARSHGVEVSDRGIEAIQQNPDCADLVFDATSALDHIKHAPILQKLGKTAIDMTPSRVGRMTVPALDTTRGLEEPSNNYNMVSCGGQASIPLANLLAEVHDDVEYIEVVSSIASKSAGPATRINLDEYIESTEMAIAAYAGCDRVKTILILNPAEPCIDMQTTVSAKVRTPRLEDLQARLPELLSRLRAYVPGYELVVPPVLEGNRIFIMVRVRGRGDYLPTYAGNLDIINCAAVATAEALARQRRNSRSEARQ